MSRRYQNAFFAFGLAVLAVMVTQLDFRQAWAGVSRAGYWFLAVLLLWLLLYVFNTAAWMVIIRSGDGQRPAADRGKVSFLWLYKITVSGFALNYATPGGLMGGEPYKVMSLRPLVGTERAASSVILHTMTHIYSHFWFWLLSCALYVLTQDVSLFMAMLLGAVTLFCLLAIWFFQRAYRRGIAVSALSMLRRFPMVRRWAQPFLDRHRERLADIDRQTAALQSQNPRAFFAAVGLELACRVLSALEILFIMLVIMPSANYVQCILILAFTSLFANMLFFMPLQLGGREGGFLMSVSGLGMTASTGIFVALLVRLRELVWTAIGLLLIRVERK